MFLFNNAGTFKVLAEEVMSYTRLEKKVSEEKCLC